MQNPTKNRNAAAGYTLAFAGVAVVMHQFGAPSPEHGWADVVVVFAVSFAGIAMLGVPFYQLQVVRYNRLLRGEDIIARWTVAERDWRHFVLDEPARNSAQGAAGNILALDARMTPEGVDVIIGKHSLMVGGDFHSLPRVDLSRISGPSWVNGSPPCLEFTGSSPSHSDTTATWALRFPVAPGAHADAEVVREHYLTRTPEFSVQREPGRMRRIGMGVTVVGAIALILGLFTFQSNLNATLVIVLLVGGILITPGGVLVAIVWHRRMPRRYKKYPH